jgi:hypothetical protein
MYTRRIERVVLARSFLSGCLAAAVFAGSAVMNMRKPTPRVRSHQARLRIQSHLGGIRFQA